MQQRNDGDYVITSLTNAATIDFDGGCYTIRSIIPMKKADAFARYSKWEVSIQSFDSF